MSDQLENCPDEFFNNCKNATVRCSYCSAFNSDQKTLLYEPVDYSVTGEHPYKLEHVTKNNQKKGRKLKNREISRRVKAAFDAESEFCIYLQNYVDPDSTRPDFIARTTLASGSIAGDGDIQILDGLLQADHKNRSSKSKTFSLSGAEYQKGINQGTNCWVIKRNAEDLDSQQIVMMTPEAFASLIKCAYDAQNSS